MNRAAQLGPEQFDWWPDWRGQTAAIIASGPSAKGTDLSPLKGVAKVLAIKENIELCPWADVVYGCDGPWWRFRRGLKTFDGPRLTYDGRACQDFPWLKRVDISKTEHRILTDEPLKIGSGMNSGFQALNLAVQFGATRIILVGFDMTDRSGPHWYGRNHWPMASNPDPNNFDRWIKAFADAVPTLTDLGVRVANASPLTHLRCFPRHSITDALRIWNEPESIDLHRLRSA